MARRSAHIPKTALPAGVRAGLPRSAFAVPGERKYPIHDLYHARLALTYALTPSNAAYRDEVVSAVLARYPELKFWWAARSRRLATPPRRKVANPSHTSEEPMPVYTLNPSHRRATKRKASSAPSLRERVAARRRNGLSEDGTVVSNPRAKTPTRKDELQRLAHAAGYHVEAYSPGDGMTRYRFFDLAEMDRKGVSVREMSYFGPLNGVDTALGLAAAKKWLSKSRTMRRNGLSEDGTVVSNPRARAGGRATRSNPPRVSDDTLVSVRHSDEYSVPLGSPATTTFGEWSKTLKRSANGIVMVGGRQFRDMGSVLKSARMSMASNGNAAIRWTTADGVPVITVLVVRESGERRKNPLSEDGVVVSNPKKRKATKKKAGSSRSGGRTAAQSNAAKAMKLFHSGKASSLAEAWDMVRRGR